MSRSTHRVGLLLRAWYRIVSRVQGVRCSLAQLPKLRSYDAYSTAADRKSKNQVAQSHAWRRKCWSRARRARARQTGGGEFIGKENPVLMFRLRARIPLLQRAFTLSTMSGAPRVLVPVATSSEEIEAVTIIDTLRRAGIRVRLCSWRGSSAHPLTRSTGCMLRHHRWMWLPWSRASKCGAAVA